MNMSEKEKDNLYVRRRIKAEEDGQLWTPFENDLLFDSGLSDTELSEFIGRSVKSIYMQRCRLNKIGWNS